MRHNTTLICGLTVGAAVLLTACGGAAPDGGQGSAQNMKISTESLGAEATRTADLDWKQSHLFNYAVDQSISSVTVKAWQYEDGKWIKVMQTSNPIDQTTGTQGRLSAQFKDNFLNVHFVTKGMEVWTPDQQAETDNAESKINQCSAQDKYVVPSEEEIKGDKEIPLWIWVGAKDGEAATNSKNFRKSKCDEGFAITAEFQKDSLKANTDNGENS